VVVLIAFQQTIEDSRGGCCISACTMAVGDFNTEALSKSAKAIRPQPGNDAPTQTNGTQLFGTVRYSNLFEFLPKERVIEMGVVGNEYFVLQLLIYNVSNLRKRRCIPNHFVRDTGEARDVCGDVPSGIDEGMIPICNPQAVVMINRYLGYLMVPGIAPRRFDVHNSVHGP